VRGLIHLVFDPTLSKALENSLISHGKNVSGKDGTLEQFRDAAKAGKIEGSTAIVNTVAGLVDKQDSVRLLKEIRSYMPELRMIAVLPEHADRKWITEIGTLGIYDVYAVEQFTIEDVCNWLDKKRTIADILDDEVNVSGKINSLQPKLTDQKSQIIVNTVERIVGCITIGIAGIDRRCGSTYTALSMASYLSRKFKVALIECRGSSLLSYQTHINSKFVSGGYQINNIDEFTSESKDQWIAIMAAGYDYVVMDFGHLDLSDEQEFMRCTTRFLLTGASDWDIEYLYVTLDQLMNKYSGAWNIVVNFALDERFKAIFNGLTSRDRRNLKLRMMQQSMLLEPFEYVDYGEWLKDVLPRESSKRGIFCNIKKRIRKV